jgi:hypothetical protein
MIRSVVEHAGLTFFAEAGLLLFAGVFVAVVINTWRRSKTEIHDLSHMALEPDDCKIR